jgi:hypothetical protein
VSPRRHHASAQAAHELSQTLLISLERFRKESSGTASELRAGAQQAGEASRRSEKQACFLGVGGFLGFAGAVSALASAAYLASGASALLAGAAARKCASLDRAAKEAAAQAKTRSLQAGAITQLATSFKALDGSLERCAAGAQANWQCSCMCKLGSTRPARLPLHRCLCPRCLLPARRQLHAPLGTPPECTAPCLRHPARQVSTQARVCSPEWPHAHSWPCHAETQVFLPSQ